MGGISAWKEFSGVNNVEDHLDNDLAALKHSIRKWKCLRPCVMKLFGITREHGNLIRDKIVSFSISSDSCALCSLYLGVRCAGCPLSKADKMCDQGSDPYSHWVRTGNPEPMIAALVELRNEYRHHS